MNSECHRKPPKDHVYEERHVDPQGPLDEVIYHLKEVAVGLSDVRLEIVDWFGDYGHDCYITGFRPMTPAELEKAKVKRKRDREANKRRKEKAREKDEAALRKLATKLGKTVS